jgi:uncharacterized protein (TIGR03067 family)
MRPTATVLHVLTVGGQALVASPERNMILAHLVLALLAAAIFSVARADDAPPQDLEKMQGRWHAVSVEDGGKKRPEDHIKDWVLIVEKDRMTAKDRDDVLDESTFKLDPSKKPAGITITYLSGADKGKVLHGIYALDGDSLKFCVTFNEKETPTEFASKEGTDLTLVVLKRGKGGK